MTQENFEFDMTRKAIPQGDVMLIPIVAIPEGVTALSAEDGKHVIAHSETGHHHLVLDRPEVKHFSAMDTFRGFLQVDTDEPIELMHEREEHPHETQIVPPGAWLIQRQRAHTPEGWKRAID